MLLSLRWLMATPYQSSNATTEGNRMMASPGDGTLKSAPHLLRRTCFYLRSAESRAAWVVR